MVSKDRTHILPHGGKEICPAELPERFTYPFHYTPHPLCIEAAEQVKQYLASRADWQEELAGGKMFGVLVVRMPDGAVRFVAAFSGILAGSNDHPYFVPPVYDLLNPEGFFKVEENNISAINREIRMLEQSPALQEAREKASSARNEAALQLAQFKTRMKEAKKLRDEKRKSAVSPEENERLIRESQFLKAEYKRLERQHAEAVAREEEEEHRLSSHIETLKAERKHRSAALQQKLFMQFRMKNMLGEEKDLCEIFAATTQKVPPAGAGECAAPKLLQYAFNNGLTPVAMAEFWWGQSPAGEIRHHGHFYPACRGKCLPILTHMLKGMEVDENPLASQEKDRKDIETLYEDEYLAVINKPAGMLSVPGKENRTSVYDIVREKYPSATGPLIVHRLDMDTSGLMLIAKSKEVHEALQKMFLTGDIRKTYTALLDGMVQQDCGTIDLPLAPDHLDRPRQQVNHTQGKKAVTEYRVISRNGNRTLIEFRPLTGRTHQLRLHAASPEGLGTPIAGDPLYGHAADRLYLHAMRLEFIHPVTKDKVVVMKEAGFNTGDR